MYGQELIMDLRGCDPARFTREHIERYLIELCELLDVTREDLHFWDYEGRPEEYAKAPEHMKGTSVVQFISKSSVVMHAIEHGGWMFINVFSCGEFKCNEVEDLTLKWFSGRFEWRQLVRRGNAWSV